jgi:uncharacterized repeat protein (TIGR01451 family)
VKVERTVKWLALLMLVLTLSLILQQDPPSARAADARPIGEELREALATYGEIPIIIQLDVPSHTRLSSEGSPTTEMVLALSQEINAVAEGVLSRSRGQSISQVKRYDVFPLLAMIVDEAALEALAADPSVIHIGLDVPVPPAMNDTLPLIQANSTHFLNYRGSGWSIAILDTGVDRTHPALFGKVVSEACYSSNVSSQGASSLCPGGATSSTATNSALPCAVGISGCDHGTHVADIAARVAPGAGIIAVQVSSRFSDSGSNTPCQNVNRTSPCTLSYTSDQVAALNRVWVLHITSNNIRVAAANMSLGGGFHTGSCDHLSEYNSLRLAINQLRDQNVATVISSGNNGYRNAMSAPACLTPAISVAASDKSDLVASYSNISAFTTLIAPGTRILAAVPQAYTPIYQAKSGTSMAAPHVAGAIATFKEAQPNATVAQIVSALSSTGPAINDQRTGGSIARRRLSTWAAVCQLITCDSDDFRSIGINQTLGGIISPAGDVDHYYYFGTAGQRLTLRMNRTSGSMDPYLELLSPSGFRVAFNDNGGGGVNALINGYLLPQNGLYQIRARSVNNFTGNYSISASSQVETLNPVPQINSLSPASATGTFFASDFWVAIYGSNFIPDSQVRWNGQLRAKFYSSPTLIYIRVLGGDIGWPWPRNAFITVENPTPGGGTSNSRAFTIQDPFLGESSLLSPESGSSVSAGISQSFVISWTAPITVSTWRDMQYMDLRLRNESGETAAWVRVVEQPGAGSFYRLLNASEELVDEGLPGEDRTLVLTDTVTLHLAESAFSGSGLTAIMTPTLTFGPAAVGTYNVEFRVDSNSGEDEAPNVQDTDVLGTFTILPEGCGVAIADVTLSGDRAGLTNDLLVFSTSVSPGNASTPMTYTWTPEPDTGQGFPNAAYSFDQAGEYIISVQVENCGAFAAAITTLRISTGADPDLAIAKLAPATAIAAEAFTYTLTITNSGAMTATNLLVRDVLPIGVNYLGGGALVNNEVQWQIPSLGGYGETAVVTFTASISTDVTNNDYRVAADGDFGSQGTTFATTRIVDAQVLLTAVTTETLSYSDADRSSLFSFPGGSVFADTLVTYKETERPESLGTLPYGGRAFRLNAYQDNTLVEEFRLYETVHISLSYSMADAAQIDPERLTLRYWQDGRWQGSGIACNTQSSTELVHCTLSNPLLSHYSLVEASNDGNTIYLPLLLRNVAAPSERAEITGITLTGNLYTVQFQTYGFTPQMPGQHVHFFFNTVPPEQAGLPGSGPWYVYGGSSPFTGYGVADRPTGATSLCVLVANPDHSVIQDTGNCYTLP